MGEKGSNAEAAGPPGILRVAFQEAPHPSLPPGQAARAVSLNKAGLRPPTRGAAPSSICRGLSAACARWGQNRPDWAALKKKNNPSSSRGTGLGRCSEQQHSQGIFLWTPGWVSLGLLAFIYIPRVSHENNIILFRFHGSLI